MRTKNLSGNVQLSTLEVYGTETTPKLPFNPNKQNGTIIENQQEVSLLSEVGTKAPTDGLEPFELMDVFNDTSGTLPNQTTTEKLITDKPLNSDTTEKSRDWVSGDAAERVNSFQSDEEIENLSAFLDVDEELLNEVGGEEEAGGVIEDIESILQKYEESDENITEEEERTTKFTDNPQIGLTEKEEQKNFVTASILHIEESDTSIQKVATQLSTIGLTEHKNLLNTHENEEIANKFFTTDSPTNNEEITTAQISLTEKDKKEEQETSTDSSDLNYKESATLNQKATTRQDKNLATRIDEMFDIVEEENEALVKETVAKTSTTDDTKSVSNATNSEITEENVTTSQISLTEKVEKEEQETFTTASSLDFEENNVEETEDTIFRSHEKSAVLQNTNAPNHIDGMLNIVKEEEEKETLKEKTANKFSTTDSIKNVGDLNNEEITKKIVTTAQVDLTDKKKKEEETFTTISNLNFEENNVEKTENTILRSYQESVTATEATVKEETATDFTISFGSTKNEEITTVQIGLTEKEKKEEQGIFTTVSNLSFEGNNVEDTEDIILRNAQESSTATEKTVQEKTATDFTKSVGNAKIEEESETYVITAHIGLLEKDKEEEQGTSPTVSDLDLKKNQKNNVEEETIQKFLEQYEENATSTQLSTIGSTEEDNSQCAKLKKIFGIGRKKETIKEATIAEISTTEFTKSVTNTKIEETTEESVGPTQVSVPTNFTEKDVANTKKEMFTTVYNKLSLKKKKGNNVEETEDKISKTYDETATPIPSTIEENERQEETTEKIDSEETATSTSSFQEAKHISSTVENTSIQDETTENIFSEETTISSSSGKKVVQENSTSSKYENEKNFDNASEVSKEETDKKTVAEQYKNQASEDSYEENLKNFDVISPESSREAKEDVKTTTKIEENFHKDINKTQSNKVFGLGARAFKSTNFKSQNVSTRTSTEEIYKSSTDLFFTTTEFVGNNKDVFTTTIKTTKQSSDEEKEGFLSYVRSGISNFFGSLIGNTEEIQEEILTTEDIRNEFETTIKDSEDDNKNEIITDSKEMIKEQLREWELEKSVKFTAEETTTTTNLPNLKDSKTEIKLSKADSLINSLDDPEITVRLGKHDSRLSIKIINKVSKI